ncbi:amidase [Lignipirellula cremea]|uniref:Glutamyl-tRNA(Gln) amidotransferase subunit A n=1 Tax=Lignipirellula cremea TaxID=2528010 RepID=A0A518E3R8_9BACT|nr:amidase [Lignipirellula cremea]QDU98737.1 Glutamyl-tRNA(Gln) amidotransferase subunit A [Lignipirellula cremea]
MKELSVGGSASPVHAWGLAEIVRRIRAGEVSSREVTAAFVARCEAVEPRIHALTTPLYEQSLAEADQADRRQAQGETLGRLHGAPFTLKECFAAAGLPATIGLTNRTSAIDAEDGPLVRIVREQGGILLGKTNVPQLMIWHECDNPVYGRTNNPWNLDRTPGGSSGGEAALIGAGGSPWGLGGDLGGSIRIPAHFCGIQGIKPTNLRLPRRGGVETLRGMRAMEYQPGPLARRVEDLQLALEVLCSVPPEPREQAPPALGDFRAVQVAGLRVGYWVDDGVFPASPAIRRAVEQSADVLRQAGVEVEPFQPPQPDEALAVYLGIMGADGGAGFRRLAHGSRLDPRIKRLMRITQIPRWLRPSLAWVLQLAGQDWQGRLLTSVQPRTTDEYWRLCYRMTAYVRQFFAALDAGRFDAMLFPPHALPAFPHGDGIDLLPAASYSFLANLLGVPAGTVAVTRVADDEQTGRPASRDRVLDLARKCDQGSAGLPVSVQIGARHWREDVVLALMHALEQQGESRADYPSVERLAISEWRRDDDR